MKNIDYIEELRYNMNSNKRAGKVNNITFWR